MEEGSRRKTGKKQRIGIRADANEWIGAGHIMRCITIAKQLRRLDCEVVFFTADSFAHSLLEEAGMEVVCLHSSWENPAEECERLSEELERLDCQKLLVDSYQVTEAYFQKLGRDRKLIYIDDCFAEVYPVDLVINYNAFHIRFPYREHYDGKAELLLGTAYVPLREEFSPSLYPERKNAKRQVLLSSGGGDVCEALTGFLEIALQDPAFRDVVFHVVAGRYHKKKEVLADFAQKDPRVCLHENVSRMGELMSRCDAAFSAAGTVLFELSAMQVPAVFFVCADNQQYDSEFFDQKERMLFAGDIRQDREACLETACRQLQRILEDRALAERMRRQLQQVTDGQGARRIAEAVKALPL